MTSKDLFEMIGQTKPTYRQQAVKALFADELRETEETKNMNRKTVWSAGRIALAAAIAALLLATTAFAANLFGVQALFTGDKIIDPAGEEYYELTMSNPQAVPEGLDADIAQRIENNQAAVAEWTEYCKNCTSTIGTMEAEWKAAAPEGTTGLLAAKVADLNDNRDVWAPVLEQYPEAFAAVVYMSGSEVLGGAPITEEEWALHEEQVEEQRKASPNEYAQYSELQWSEYGINSQEDADKLEEIAAKYGLMLQEERHVVWSGNGSFETYDDLTEIMTSAGCAGNIFNDLPTSIEKIAWYNEGSFCINCDVALPSGQRAMLRACKSMYSTLVGNEIRGMVSDVDALATRNYTAADGTELTVLSDSEEVFVYVFLEDSFFVVNASNIGGTEAMTQEDINYIADFFNYSLIEG